MVLPHSFVLAKLNPTRTLYWISSFVGHDVANRIVRPRPFVAVKMEASHIRPKPEDVLLAVSTEKPPTRYPGYVPIFPHNDGPRSPIRTTPPLPPGGQKLYIHTGKWLYLHHAAHDRDNWQAPFIIDPEDFARLYHYALEDNRHNPDYPWKIRERQIAEVGSGGPEQVGSEWSSFSGGEPTEGLNRTSKIHFDLSSLSTMPAHVDGPLNIYNEVKILECIGNDYSWVGVSDTIKYAEELKPNPVPFPQLAFSSIPASFKTTPHALTLTSMTVPLDGEQQKLDSESPPDSEIWDDEWQPDLVRSPGELLTAVPKNLRMIWFDVHGTISDRETAIKDALQPILNEDPMLRTQNEGLSLYLECEARSPKHLSSYRRILGALQDFCNTIGVDIQNHHRTFVSTLTDLRTWPDVPRALDALRQTGYRIVASSNSSPALPGSKLNVLFDHIFENDCAFHQVLPDSLFKQVLKYCRDEHAAETSQILLVTSNAYRGVEPASAFGIPTAHLRRPGYLESSEKATEFVLTKPSYVISDLLELCHELGVDV